MRKSITNINSKNARKKRKINLNMKNNDEINSKTKD